MKALIKTIIHNQSRHDEMFEMNGRRPNSLEDSMKNIEVQVGQMAESLHATKKGNFQVNWSKQRRLPS